MTDDAEAKPEPQPQKRPHKYIKKILLALLLVFVIVDAAGAGWTALCVRGSDSHDTPTWRSPDSIASSAARLTTHYMENVIDKPGTNEQLLREYIGIYKRFERAIREPGGDDADASAKRQD